MFTTVLVANRGEIAVRVIRTLRSMGIKSVAVYSDADRGALHVRVADESVNIGPAGATESYLRQDRIIQAAYDTGAQAIHPGYGFLAESVDFARACAEAGITFIGPGAQALDIMGDKVRARHHLAASGVPEVPGFDAMNKTDAEIAIEASLIGYPLLIKPSAGGGGKGMEIVHSEGSLAAALASARRVAIAAFGDDTLLIERLIERPRHIEVQVFGTSQGEMLALGERECTLQRRHQKVIEESPNAGGISSETVEALSLAAIRTAQSVDYVGAGTVEFLVDADRPDELFFIEMNTRLQVEHPVTEAVLGLDLVELQVRTAAQEDVLQGPIWRSQLIEVVDPATQIRAGWRIEPSGHAIEARVYAEAPERGFIPSAGDVLLFMPSPHARVDTAVETGDAVSPLYDPMIAKIISFADTRAEALRQLDAALGETTILGIDTNIKFLRDLIIHPRVQKGDLDTGLIDTLLPLTTYAPPELVLEEVARVLLTSIKRTARTDWTSPVWRTHVTKQPVTLIDDDGNVRETPANPQPATQVTTAADQHGAVWASYKGASWKFTMLTRRDRTLQKVTGESKTAPGASCESPMPGRVVVVHVVDGSEVTTGDPLVSIEAMKMEHPVLAPYPGVVRMLVVEGDQVRRGQQVAVVERQEGAS